MSNLLKKAVPVLMVLALVFAVGGFAANFVSATEVPTGFIRVCKVVLDAEGNPVVGEEGATFEIGWLDDEDYSGTSEGDEAAVPDTVVFDTPLTWNEEVDLSDLDIESDGNNAECEDVEIGGFELGEDDLPAGTYYYAEESIDSEDEWEDPLYDDGFNDDGFGEYNSGSGEEFDNFDGVINIGDDEHRTLIVVNTMKESEPTVPTVTLEKSVESTGYRPQWGDTKLTYTINWKVTGSVDDLVITDVLPTSGIFLMNNAGTPTPNPYPTGFDPLTWDFDDEENSEGTIVFVIEAVHAQICEINNKTTATYVYDNSVPISVDSNIVETDLEGGPCDEPEPLVCEAGVNLIENGSFEDPIVTNGAQWDIFELVLGWSIDWMNPDGVDPSLELHRGVAGWLSALGDQHAELDGDWYGPANSGQGGASTKIWQNVPTIVGETYKLKFSFSPRPQTQSPDNVLGVLLNGSDITNSPFSDTNNTNQTTWTEYTEQFTADNALTTVQFEDRGTENSLGTFLDNVSLECLECDEEVTTVIVSDTTNEVGEGFAVETYEHAAWVDEFGDAKWIWDAAQVTDPESDQTRVFTKTFNLDGAVTSAELKIAADNGYKVEVNGNVVVDNLGVEANYGSLTSYDVASLLYEGSNTIEITVKNFALADSTPESNPAGVIYELTILANECEDGVPPPETAEITIVKVTESGDGEFHFNGLSGEDGFDLTTEEGSDSRTFDELTPGIDYTIGESALSGWDLTSKVCQGTNWNNQWSQNGDGSISVNLQAGSNVTCTFTNTKIEENTSTVSGMKWNDENSDRQNDEESGISGWLISIFADESLVDSTTTDGSGNYIFTGLNPELDYWVCEETQSGWVQTSPIILSDGTVNCANGTVGYSAQSGDGADDFTNKNFGNHETPPSTQCSDDTNNDADQLIDENDPGCHTDGNASDSNSYDPQDDDESDEPTIFTESGDGGRGITSSGSRRSTGQVLGAATEICNWNSSYMRRGWRGNVAGDVMKVQQDLLNAHEGNTLAVDGIYGPLTEAAVKAFQ
ncbi:MAG: SdrD B-like domain-containing protein, partial [Patescibacteria group bacterium]